MITEIRSFYSGTDTDGQEIFREVTPELKAAKEEIENRYKQLATDLHDEIDPLKKPQVFAFKLQRLADKKRAEINKLIISGC